jgi:HPt (histidine-containing phosphotransfer) domain-containing protein
MLIFSLSPTDIDVNNADNYEDLIQGETSDSGENIEVDTNIDISADNTNSRESVEEMITEGEKELAGLSPDEMDRLYDQFQSEENDDDYELDRILDHTFKDGILLFQVRNVSDGNLGEHV